MRSTHTKVRHRTALLFAVFVLALPVLACGSRATAEPTSTLEPTATPRPTSTINLYAETDEHDKAHHYAPTN